MRILITRPEDAAADFSKRLEALGHNTLCASLLTVRFREGAVLTLDGVQAILATSANGVRALAMRAQRRDLPVFAVGPQTAQAARLAGFARIECADGDAEALAEAVPHWARPERGALLHATGKQGSEKLKGLLAAKGYDVRSEILYEVIAAPALPATAARALAAGTVDAAFFFSPRSARVFREGVARAGLECACASVAAVCISEAVAKALTPLAFRSVKGAAGKNRDDLIACLAILPPA
jgi:uroporphyrinogen-III synthase